MKLTLWRQILRVLPLWPLPGAGRAGQGLLGAARGRPGHAQADGLPSSHGRGRAGPARDPTPYWPIHRTPRPGLRLLLIRRGSAVLALPALALLVGAARRGVMRIL